MEHLLKQVEDRTESVIKKHCEDWLSCEVTTMEKAFPYLPSTLMALLAAKASNKEKAAYTLEFLQEHEFDGKWAQKPEVLLEDWKNEDKEVVPKVEKAYQFIIGNYKEMTLEQLESTGDLELWQLKRLLPYLSAILLSSLAEWVSEEQADPEELLNYLKDHYEELKRATPSKLMEILKQEEAFGEQKPEEEEKSESEEDEIVLPSFSRMLPFILGIIGLTIIIFWLNSPDVSSAADLVPWNKNKKQEEVSNPKIWHLNDTITLELQGDDPLNKFVERLAGISPDSTRKFFLRNVSWQDTLLPKYYANTIEHIKTLNRAFPDQKFHISITLIQQKKKNSEIPIEKRLDKYLKSNFSALLYDNNLTYSINLSSADNWSPDISDELTFRAEMEWTIIIRQ